MTLKTILHTYRKLRSAKATAVALLLVLACGGLGAQVRFDYGVDARMLFDNRENDGSGNMFTPSMTIFAFRLNPEIGMKAVTGSPENGYGFRGETVHRVMAGIDATADFGSGVASRITATREEGVRLLGEVTLYYSMEKQLSPKLKMELYAGIFSKDKTHGLRNQAGTVCPRYGDAFYSDSLRFYDPNYEGLLLSFTRPRSKWEVGVDWLGQIGKGRRERFVIFSAGEAAPRNWLKLGYSAYMYHFDNSLEVRGVVDNILLNPYVDFDLAPFLPLDRFSFSLGYLQAFQRDRINIGGYQCPQGGEFIFEMRKWNLSLRNTLYFGRDLMPLYNCFDAGGNKYGSELYFGDPYYRVRTELAAAERPALYDRIDIFWEPRIAPGLYLKVAARLNFNGRYSGSSQIVALRFDLQELTNR